MRTPDIPEVLIAMGLVAMLVWAIYNRLHPGVGRRK
jgi:hypothetical protein